MTQDSDITDHMPGGSAPGEGDHPAQAAGGPDQAAAAVAVPGASSGEAAGLAGGAAGLAGEAAAPPEPSWPSPYLTEPEGVPEAYPAPPQPGRPRYGTPADSFLPGQAFRPGQQGSPQQQDSGRPGFAPGDFHPAGRQPGFGQSRVPFQQRAQGPGAARTRAGLRDPALAAAWERLAASIVDWLLILAVAFLTLAGPMLRLGRELDAVLVNSQTLSPTSAQSALDNVLQSSSTTRTLVSFWLIAFAIALAYYWALQALGGATLGKRTLGLRVVNSADRSSIGVRTAGIRTGAFLLGPVILLLVPGVVDLIGGLLWMADCASAITDPGMRCLHDRLAGTSVVRKRSLS